MKNFNKILLIVLTVVGLTVFSAYAEAASVGTSACSISPGSASMSQSSSVVFTATSDHPSVSGDYVYVTAREFSKGVYSDINVGKVIPIGASSLDLRVYAENTAETGSKTFKVYCSTGCPMSGCPSGGTAEVLGSATVSLEISGSNVSGGDIVPVDYIPPVVPSNVSGKVRLTQIKELFGSMFPSGVCQQGVSNCREGFGANGSLMSPISVMLGGSEASLVGGETIRLPGGSNTGHPKLFSLANPLAPVDSGLSGQIRAGGAYDTYGDFGSTLRVTGVAYSKDKSVWALSDSQGNYYVWKNGKRYKHPQTGNSTGGAVQGIVKVGSNYVLLSPNKAFDITNGMKFVETYVDLEGQTKEVDELYLAPSGFTDLPYGKKFILRNDEFILTLNNLSQIGARKMSVNSVNSSSVIAEHNLPLRKSQYNELYGVVSVSGAEYIYFLRSSPIASSQLLDVYKFDYATKKITEVVENVSLLPGFITKATDFGANSSNPGIAVFNETPGSSGAKLTKMQVYLFSDLSQNNVVDSLANSPVWTDNLHSPNSIASFTVGDATYLYTSDARIYKLEFNANTNVTPAVTPSSAYVPLPDPVVFLGCPGGTVYDTSAGKLCVDSSGGVTTTTSFNFNTTSFQLGCITGGTYNTITGAKCPVTASKKTEFMGPPVSDGSTLREGSSGEDVKDLQRFLNAELNISLTIDGKLGAKTVAAIKQWQAENSLTSDGVVGPKTREKMNAI